MVRLAFYLGLTLLGVSASLISPLAGAITCIQAYLLNPVVLIGEDSGMRFQLWASMAFFAGFLLRPQQFVPRAGREATPLVLLWIFVAIGTLSAAWAVVSAQQALDQIYELFKTVLIISAMVRVVRSTSDMSMLVTACMLGVWHAAAMHTFGVRFGYVPAAYSKEFGVLPDGQTPVMLLFIPLFIVSAIMGTRVQKIIAWCGTPFVLNSIASSYMRTGFVSLALEAIMVLLFLPKRTTLKLLPVLLVGGGLFIFRLTPDDYWNRMSTIKAPTEEASANSRFVIAETSLRMLADYPLGVGYRNYPDVSPRYLAKEFLTEGKRSAHNSFFSIACETGIPGFLIWISAFGGTILLLRRIRKTSDSRSPGLIAAYAMAFEIGLYGWLAGGLFQADHEVDPAYWFVAFTVILTRLHASQATSEEVSDEISGSPMQVASSGAN